MITVEEWLQFLIHHNLRLQTFSKEVDKDGNEVTSYPNPIWHRQGDACQFGHFTRINTFMALDPKEEAKCATCGTPCSHTELDRLKKQPGYSPTFFDDFYRKSNGIGAS